MFKFYRPIFPITFPLIPPPPHPLPPTRTHILHLSLSSVCHFSSLEVTKCRNWKVLNFYEPGTWICDLITRYYIYIFQLDPCLFGIHTNQYNSAFSVLCVCMCTCGLALDCYHGKCLMSVSIKTFSVTLVSFHG